jgi:hypothetical protein
MALQPLQDRKASRVGESTHRLRVGQLEVTVRIRERHVSRVTSQNLERKELACTTACVALAARRGFVPLKAYQLLTKLGGHVQAAVAGVLAVDEAGVA